MIPVAKHWDRDGRCCKDDCTNPQGTTATGVRSLQCQMHTDAWEFRLAQLQADKIIDTYDSGGAPRFALPTLPVFTVPPPAPDPDAADMCERCGDAPRLPADSLCDDCRHPVNIPPGQTKAEAVRAVLAAAGFTEEDVHG